MNPIRQRQTSRWLCLVVVACLVGLVVVQGAAAADWPTIRNSQLGFSHQFHNRHWTPLQVDIENPGPARQAVLVIEGPGQLSLTKPVRLPAHSRRTVLLSVFPDVPERPAGTRLQKGENDIIPVLVAKLTDGGLQTWSTFEVLGKVIPESAAVLLAADNRRPTYPLPAEIGSGLIRRPAVRLSIPVRDLPARVGDYEGVNVVVLGDPGDTELHAMQSRALVDWVHAGGTLWINATDNPGADWPAHFDTLSPLRFSPPDRLGTDRRLGQWGNVPVFPDGLPLRRLTAGENSRILAGDQHSPLLVEHRVGLGRVVAFGLDAGNDPFRRWAGATLLNGELLTLSLDTIPAADRILAGSPATEGIISSLAGVKVPGRGPILIYLVVIVAGSVLVLIGFRFTSRPEYGWLVVIVLALLAGVGAIYGARRWKNQPQAFLNEISVLHVSPDRQGAVAQTVWGLYSPREARYDFSAPAETARLRPGGSSRAISAEPFNFRLDDRLRVTGLNVRANDLRPLSGRALLALPAVPDAQAQVSAAGVSVTFTNPLPYRLEDCFLKLNRLIVPLGDVPAGAARAFENVPPGSVGSEARYSTRVVQTPEEELRHRVRRLFFPDPVYQLGQRALTGQTDRFGAARSQWPTGVYGWSATEVFPLRVETKELARRSIGLWAVAAPVNYRGPRLTLPRGVMTLRLRDRQARQYVCGEGRFTGARGARLVVEFGLPPGCPDLTVERAQVAVQFRGSAYNCQVQLQPPGFSDDNAPSRLTTSLAGGPVYPIANPGQWYDPVRRSFTVVVAVEPTADAEKMAPAVNYWQIRELEMELGGTTP